MLRHLHLTARMTAILVVAALTSTLPAAVIHVPSRAAPTIQAGIDLARNGDLVLVAAGTYLEAIDFLGKTITVEGEAGAEQTIIDASGLVSSVVTVASGEGPGSILRGFTITGGAGTLVGDNRRGGGVYVDGSHLHIDECIISANSVDGNGGGIYAINDATLVIIGCTIANNSAGNGAGGLIATFGSRLDLLDSLIENNTSDWATGGVIVSHNAAVGADIRNCTFRGNTAEWGGALNVNLNGHAEIHDCTFEDNHAPIAPGALADGGALWIHSSGTAQITDSHFIGNTSGQGGAVRNHSGNASFTGCTFTDNVAQRGGGAVSSGASFASPIAPTFAGCTFTGNIAHGEAGLFSSRGGGAVSNARSNTQFTDCTFIGNQSTSGDAINVPGGGAVLNHQCHPVFVNCTFEGNSSATQGGAISVHGATDFNHPLSLTAVGCVFIGNAATGSGGAALTFRDGSASPSTFRNCTFAENSVSGDGGAVATYVSPSDLLGAVFENCTFDTNSAGGAGGGVSAGGTVHVLDCAFIGNQAALGGGASVSASSHVHNCHFERNTAGRGGGLHATSIQPLSVIVLRCTFERNSATGVGPANGGGGVYAGNHVRIIKCAFTGNTAVNGGGVRNVPLAAGVHACTFTDNHASENGGGINGHAENSIFIGNTAVGSGGAVATSAGALRGNTFIGNSAGVEGGAVFNSSQSNAIIANGIFCENVPDHTAGPINDSGSIYGETCREPQTIHVPGDHSTIQAAINAATHGDEIIVAPGTYQEDIVFGGKRVAVRSSHGPAMTTILRAAASTHVRIDAGPGAALDGFALENSLGGSGRGVFVGGNNMGYAQIIDCIIRGYTAGGIRVFGYAELSGVQIVESSFPASFGAGGATIGIGSLGEFENCEFRANTGDTTGGVYLDESAAASFHDCVFRENVGASGGAIRNAFFLSNPGPIVANTEFCENQPVDISGPWRDLGGNTFLDECAPGPGNPYDLSGDGVVDVQDLLILLGAWGACPDCNNCPADLSGDCHVDVQDLLILLANWGG